MGKPTQAKSNAQNANGLPLHPPFTPQASTLASLDSRTGDLAWRHVISPEDTILATSAPTAGTSSTATVSSGGRVIRLWSKVDGSLLWETFLGLAGAGTGAGASSEGLELAEGRREFRSAKVVVTDGGYVAVLSAGGIHVLSAASGAVLAQWWCDPAREPDLAALVGSDVEVTNWVGRGTVLRRGEGEGYVRYARVARSRRSHTCRVERFLSQECCRLVVRC